MSKASNSTDKSPTPSNRSAVVLMLGDIADTTWRMFVPTVGLMTAGYFADQTLGTKPWLFVLGLIVGSVIAGKLVYNQLKKS